MRVTGRYKKACLYASLKLSGFSSFIILHVLCLHNTLSRQDACNAVLGLIEL